MSSIVLAHHTRFAGICSLLTDRPWRTVGAREDLQLRSYVCDEQLGIARFQVAMQSPVIASDENVREIALVPAQPKLH